MRNQRLSLRDKAIAADFNAMYLGQHTSQELRDVDDQLRVAKTQGFGSK
jgi:hypothetical protein